MEVLWFGYRVPFLVTPLSDVPIPLPSYSPSSVRGLALSAAVADLSAKGAIEPAPLSPGFYSRLFVTPQGHRGLAACNRPLPSQPVCSSLSFSHGDSTVGPPVSASWGFDGVSAPEGRVPSGFCSSEVSLLPEILCRGGGLSIPCSLLRPFDCPAGVHSRHDPDFVDYASSRVPDPKVPQRLASPWVLIPAFGLCEGLSLLALLGARCPGQPGEELPHSHSDLGLPGDAASDASFEGFPDPQTCPKARISSLRLHLLSSATSGSLASAVGGHVISGIDRSGVSALDAVSSAASELRRPSSSGLGQCFLGCLLP